MIDRPEAERIAREELVRALESRDPLFSGWGDAATDDPELVCDVWRRPSYWSVSIRTAGCTVGFVRVLGDGRIEAVGSYVAERSAGKPRPVEAAPFDGGAARAAATQHLGADETAREALLVHDGPRGREAWLVETLRAGRPHRWLFVTSGGVYERRAGEPLDPSLE